MDEQAACYEACELIGSQFVRNTPPCLSNEPIGPCRTCPRGGPEMAPTVSGPKLCVVDDKVPCSWRTIEPCSMVAHRRCLNCNGDGTRSVHTPAPDGSVLLSAEQAREVYRIVGEAEHAEWVRDLPCPDCAPSEPAGDPETAMDRWLGPCECPPSTATEEER